MSILEKDFYSNFTQVPNTITNDNKVSFKAKGLYLYMVSKPNKWEFSLNGIASQSKETKQSILNIMKELIKHGYMTKIKKRTNGRQATNDYKLHLEPIDPSSRSEYRKQTQKNKLSNSDSVKHTTSNTNPSNTKTRNKEIVSFRKKENAIKIFTQVYNQTQRADYAYLEASRGLTYQQQNELKEFKTDFVLNIAAERVKQKKQLVKDKRA